MTIKTSDPLIINPKAKPEEKIIIKQVVLVYQIDGSSRVKYFDLFSPPTLTADEPNFLVNISAIHGELLTS